MLEMPNNIETELARLKQYFPYRIVWCGYKDGEWVTGANLDNRQANKHMREGWKVWKVK
jgi:hypothetical protein